MLKQGHVIVAHEKHGTFTYESAFGIVKQRLEEGYWYDNWDDGDPNNQWKDRAEAIMKLSVVGDGALREQQAWEFLKERDDFEYESVELQEIR